MQTRLRPACLILPTRNPEEEAVFPMRRVSAEDRWLVRTGAVFYWNIGEHTDVTGRQRTVSELRFRRLPALTNDDIAAARREGKELHDWLTGESSRVNPPAADELEISFFGPSYGESVVLHVGDGQWLIVDSCLSPSTGEPQALEYLKAIRADFSRIRAVVATHWDNDHFVDCRNASSPRLMPISSFLAPFPPKISLPSCESTTRIPSASAPA